MKNIKNINLGEDICIDIGSDFISIYIVGSGIVLREPSVIAYNINTREIELTGAEAAAAQGKSPLALKVVRPIQSGKIVDFDLASELISRLLAKVKKNHIIKPRYLLTLPCSASDVEVRALVGAVAKSGARQILTLDSPVAAALGAGCDISLARGLMVLDIGGGKTDIAAISVCKTVEKNTISTSGRDFTLAVRDYIKKKYHLEIGEVSAQKIKEAAYSEKGERKLQVLGTDTASFLPRRAQVYLPDADDIFEKQTDKISNLIKDTLNSVAPELLGDISEDGILAVGGGARLFGITQILSKKSAIRLFPADEIDLCTIKGAGIAMENLDFLPNIAKIWNNI